MIKKVIGFLMEGNTDLIVKVYDLSWDFDKLHIKVMDAWSFASFKLILLFLKTNTYVPTYVPNYLPTVPIYLQYISTYSNYLPTEH